MIWAAAGSIIPPIERASENDGRCHCVGRTPVVRRPAPDLGEAEPPVEDSGGLIVLGNFEQQTSAASTAQSIRNGCQQLTGYAAAPKLRQDAKRQYLGVRINRKSDHKPDGLVLDPGESAETAGHRQNLCHRHLVPGIVEAAGM